MFNFFKIADNTFKESVREPIYFLMLLCALALIGHFPAMALFVFSEQLKLVVDSAMATSLLFGLVAAVLCASHTVSREMRNGTVLLLLSKPVHRWSFVLAKIAGIALAASLFAILCNLSSLIAVYIAVDQFRMDMSAYFAFMAILIVGCVIGMVSNFTKGSSFAAVATGSYAILIPLYAVYCLLAKERPAIAVGDLVLALVLINMAVLAMSTLAVVFATRLDVVANLSVCSGLFFLGLVSGYIFGRDTGSEILNVVFGIIYAILPNWQYFWLADAIAANRPIPGMYVVWSGVYVTLFVTICSMWATAIFQNKEIAGDQRQ
jgi:ABC-type transport system involved in multi-copper enzyme maturation permease subunit